MKEIWQFLSVLLAGILVACALVYWMVREDPLGKKMDVSQVLLSPETIETLSNRTVVSGKDRAPEYLIESIRFNYFDPEAKKWQERLIDIAPYRKFYEAIEQDRGVIDLSEKALESFQGRRSKLTLFVKHYTAMTHEGSLEVFQTLEFDEEGEMYRIDLHFDSNERQWVYFAHPKIGKLALELLNK